MEMYCYQCEQTTGGRSCSTVGLCGKDTHCAALQDIIVQQVKVLGWYLKHNYIESGNYMQLIYRALFATITNVNFDQNALAQLVKELDFSNREVKAGTIPPCGEIVLENYDIVSLLNAAQYHTLAGRRGRFGDTVAGLQELILYGLKGTAAYIVHAMEFGGNSSRIDFGFIETLAFLASDPQDIDSLVPMALRAGELNYEAMESLDAAHVTNLGHPEPTTVRTTAIAGKCILVSGHDLHDLELLLKQVKGKKINVYTHGEMLPANAYPEFKKYPNLVGNYGGAWQNQQSEFADFPGAILMTSNCMQAPQESYKDRIFTTGPVAWPGTVHIGKDKDFSPVISAALIEKGFASDQLLHEIITGFAHHTFGTIADQVVEAIKDGSIRHIFLIGGCDGARLDRSYYCELAKSVPDDCIVMTLACGKYRFNKMDFGSIAGVPRLLDIGQCNDAYSAIRIAIKLADKLDCTVNELPLSIMLSWYEQKAIAVLLTLLYLGVKNIKLGPSIPAFITPDILTVLSDTFNLSPISDASEDIASALSGACLKV